MSWRERECNCESRTVILNHLPTIIKSHSNETNLTREGSVDIEGCVRYGNNRNNHVNARQGTGGVGICVKTDLLSSYDVEVIEKKQGRGK